MNRFLLFLLCVWAIALSLIVFKTQRHDTIYLLIQYAVAFAAYVFILIKTKSELDQKIAFYSAIILRGVFLFSFPLLSDDIYRFIWDGRLTNLGISPFAHPPQYFVDNQQFTGVLTPELFDKLNSKNYYSVYPTVCQSVFALATFLFPKSIYGATFFIKSFLFICEIGSLLFIKKIVSENKKNKTQNDSITIYPELIYALNPLVLVELNANAHFEAAMIFFLLAAFYVLNKNNWLAMFSWTLAIMSKMLPLLFLPLLWKYLGWKKSIKWGLVALLFLVLLLLPIYNSLLFNNLGQSLNLYFSKFEFNASVYYLLRNLGIWYFGYNPIVHITRLSSILTVLFILKKILFYKKNYFEEKGEVFSLRKPSSLPKTEYSNNDSSFTIHHSSLAEDCLFIICVYFLTATTVHPWYATLPLVLACLTSWRFPIVWTALIMLTYAGYTEGSSKHTENYILIAIEYLLTIGYFFFEIRQKRQGFNTKAV